MTTKSESHTRTLPFAKYAIEQIERFGLPAEPKSFELWYRYAQGTIRCSIKLSTTPFRIRPA